MKKILITGGAGFIGSAVARLAILRGYAVVNFDILNYGSSLRNVENISQDINYTFVKGDIRDAQTVKDILNLHKPDLIMHLAAESHVDRSISDPQSFVKTNINGTFNLLNASYNYWVEEGKPTNFRFHFISTDEVYGSLGKHGKFSEDSPYAPNNPYSASKAGADHLVRAYNKTFSFPTLITNCSNNYGPHQFSEKLIPSTILNAIKGNALPVYGDGTNLRDWLYVDDHVEALFLVLTRGRVGRTYNIGGDNELQNIEVVQTICELLERKKPVNYCYSELIEFVPDRFGHDKRYAIDSNRIKTELSWSPTVKFIDGIQKTVEWYIYNENWWNVEDI